MLVVTDLGLVGRHLGHRPGAPRLARHPRARPGGAHPLRLVMPRRHRSLRLSSCRFTYAYPLLIRALESSVIQIGRKAEAPRSSRRGGGHLAAFPGSLLSGPPTHLLSLACYRTRTILCPPCAHDSRSLVFSPPPAIPSRGYSDISPFLSPSHLSTWCMARHTVLLFFTSLLAATTVFAAPAPVPTRALEVRRELLEKRVDDVCVPSSSFEDKAGVDDGRL